MYYVPAIFSLLWPQRNAKVKNFKAAVLLKIAMHFYALCYVTLLCFQRNTDNITI